LGQNGFLDSDCTCEIFADVTNRDIAIDLIQRLPENTPLQDIAKELEFIAAVREGFDQIEQGEGVPAEKVRRMIPSWITR
jgi:predicted transcriptional regulator